MLFCVLGFQVVAQTKDPASGYANVDWRLSAKGSAGVTFTLTFNDEIEPGASGSGIVALSNSSFVQIDPIQVKAGQATSTNSESGSSVTFDGKKLIITFKNEAGKGTNGYRLDEDATYFITVSNNAVRYKTGASVGTYWPGLKANGTTIDYSFKTGDYTAPVIAKEVNGKLNVTPEDNSFGFAVGGTLSATFDDLGNILKDKGNVAIYLQNGSLVEMFDIAGATTTTKPAAGKLGISGKTLYIKPTNNLTNLANYYVRISKGAITDTQNKFPFAGINDNTTWNFTAKDAEAPIVAFNPKNGAIRVANESTLKLSFTDKRTDAGLTFELRKPDGTTFASNAELNTSILLQEVAQDGVTVIKTFATTEYSAIYSAKNEITVSLKNSAKFSSGSKYLFGVKANQFGDEELNLIPATSVVFKADDTVAPEIKGGDQVCITALGNGTPLVKDASVKLLPR